MTHSSLKNDKTAFDDIITSERQIVKIDFEKIFNHAFQEIEGRSQEDSDRKKVPKGSENFQFQNHSVPFFHFLSFCHKKRFYFKAFFEKDSQLKNC